MDKIIDPVALQEAGEAVSSFIGGGTVEKTQACFLPNSQDGVPVIGKVPNVEGAYIASGGAHHAVQSHALPLMLFPPSMLLLP